MSRTFLSTWDGAGTSSDPFTPAVARHTDTWSAIDGRTDPSVAAGFCIVETPDLNPSIANAISKDPDIVEITDDNVDEEMQKNVGLSADTKDKAKKALADNRGATNALFRKAR